MPRVGITPIWSLPLSTQMTSTPLLLPAEEAEFPHRPLNWRLGDRVTRQSHVMARHQGIGVGVALHADQRPAKGLLSSRPGGNTPGRRSEAPTTGELV